MYNNLAQEIANWFSFHWFLPTTFLEFSWKNPNTLYLLLFLPFLFGMRWLLNWRSRQKVPVTYTRNLLQAHAVHWIRFIPEAVFMLFLASLIVALSRPQIANLRIEQSSEGIDILLVMDISESMLITDFQPNRLESAKDVAIDFIRGRNYDRIGIVLFSGDAYSLCPLTTDYWMLEDYISQINHRMIPQSGTAIGTALGVATNRLRASNLSSKVIIIISDGDNTAGNLDPITAAQLAAYYGIKIYTIVVGSEGQVLVPNPMTGRMEYEENTVDLSILKEIAQIGEGQFFQATNRQALAEIFAQINSYEKSEITETRFQTTQDFYYVYVTWGIIFLLIWLFLKSTFLSNVLED